MVHLTVSGLFEDYVRFHALELRTCDVDPVYPVLRELADICDWDAEERVRAVFLHVAYYDFGSALAAIDRRYGAFLRACTDPVPGLVCGTERRRHRMGNHLAEHLANLNSIANQHNGLSAWLQHWIGDDPVENWQAVTRNCLLQVTGNGRWAAFKTAEMLAEVAELPLRAPDMGHANSSGPRKGLSLLFEEARLAGNTPDEIEQLNAMSYLLCEMLQERGLSASLENTETTLCDFHSLWAGRYYPGHDIDQMLGQLKRASLGDVTRERVMSARSLTLPHAYLGELHGWDGIDRERARAYKRTGEILTRG